MDYLQADVFAGPHLTIVGGEFLTPFGTYNERLTQIWLENFREPAIDLWRGYHGDRFGCWRNAARLAIR